MAAATGATPLIALEAVALDTETTGLDTRTAHIVEIGAVAVSRSARAPGPAFRTLVRPPLPIPAAASAIHGISDADVADAPGFASAWAAFSAFAAGRVLIGYSIGYDLAILEREAQRAGMSWTKPRTLCVRMLAGLVNPALPDYSLDMIAGWLGVAVAGRHRAVGDAAAAADIFLALLPKLRDRGVRTLGEAERACLGLVAELESQQRAGWAEPVSRPEPDAGALGAVDPYAYRHRVDDVMSAPPVVIREDTPALDAIRLMMERRISSAFISGDGLPGGPVASYGIVTERDMMRRIAASGAAAFAEPVGGFASRPLLSIRAGAFVYRAVGRMDRLKIRHLAVRDEAGVLAGVVSARDLLKLRAGAAIDLDDAIEAAGSAAELAAAWATLPAVAGQLLAETVDARTVAEIVSEELRAMTRRAAILAERQMADEGRGPPPCPYAVLVLGSGGRGESLLAADQDNAIVFAEGEAGGPEDRWFEAMAQKLADILDASGIPYCKGGVMAKNAAWRGSFAAWRARIGEWVRRARPEDLLNVDIVFDLRPVHGDLAMGRALFADAYEQAEAHTAFAKLLGEQLNDLGSPFALFGGLRTEAGRVDLKKFGLFPIVSAARTLAIRHGVRAHSTKDRLEGLIARDIGGDADMQAMLSGHALLLGLMLAQQSRDLHAGLPVSNKVETARLTPEELAELKALLRRLQAVPALVRDLMFG